MRPGTRLHDLLADPLAEDHLVGVGAAVVEVLDEQEGRREPQLRPAGIRSRRVVVLGEVAVDEGIQVFDLDRGVMRRHAP